MSWFCMAITRPAFEKKVAGIIIQLFYSMLPTKKAALNELLNCLFFMKRSKARHMTRICSPQ